MNPPELPHWPYPLWIAHRGAGKLAPENTLAAFRLGASLGYRMFECDVKLSSDGQAFLLHDDTLERTTNAHQAPAGALNPVAGNNQWAQLAGLDAGSWHSAAFAAEPLPTLAQIAHFCIANGCFLNIEIKPSPGTSAQTGREVARMAQQLWQGQATPPLLSSFEPEALEAAQASAPALPRALLLDTLWSGWMDAAQRLQCRAIVCNYRLWNPSLVEQVHSAGMRALSYTVNADTAAAQLQDWGTDGIITDRVDHFRPSGH